MSKRTRQYMSAIFYHNENQQRLAIETKNEFERKKQKGKVMTQISPAETFYDAEEYHQKYVLKQHPWLLVSLDLDPEEVTKSHVCSRLNGYIGGYGDEAKFKEEVPKLGLTSEQANYVIKAARTGNKTRCGV